MICKRFLNPLNPDSVPDDAAHFKSTTFIAFDAQWFVVIKMRKGACHVHPAAPVGQRMLARNPAGSIEGDCNERCGISVEKYALRAIVKMV